MTDSVYDLVVIGSGPAGYTGAIRASQLGMRTACVEKEDRLGGTCLRVGCIPSKALLESSHLFVQARDHLGAHGIILGEPPQCDVAAMMRRKDEVVRRLTGGIDGLFRKNKVDRVAGTASFGARRDDGLLCVKVEGGPDLTARRVLVASGSKEARLPGVELDFDRIGTSTEALCYPQVPGRLVVIGAGAIGLELGSVWRRLGAEVVVLEYADRILPGMDADLAAQAQKAFAKSGIDFRMGSRVQRAYLKGPRCLVEVEGQPPLEADRVLMCTGRVPNTDGLGLGGIGVVLDDRGRIPVDANFATAAANVYAVGDATVGPMLAHKGEEEAVACVEQMAGQPGHVDYNLVPYVVYTMPEVASVGASEESLRRAGVDYRRGAFPFAANGRAQAVADTAGFVKILADKRTDRILGAHILSSLASEQISEVAAAMAFGASSEDLARVCHPHPTRSEAIREAALAVDGRTLNL